MREDLNQKQLARIYRYVLKWNYGITCNQHEYDPDYYIKIKPSGDLGYPFKITLFGGLYE